MHDQQLNGTNNDHINGAHLRRAPIYQPPDIKPEPIRMSGFVVVGLWILAALFFGSVLAIGLPS